MKPEEIIKAAWNGKRPPGMKFPEHRLYYTMRMTYAMYRRGEINKNDGELLKTEALKQYEKDKQKHEELVEAYGVMD